MKKLVVTLMMVAVAGLTHAATCTWGSGAFRTAASAEGGWSSTTVNAAGALVTMSIYFVDSTTYAGLAGKTQKELFDTYSVKTADLTGQNKNASNTLIGAITITDSSAPANVQYGVAIATYTDATYGDMYMANIGQTTFNSATQKGSVGNLMSSVGNWQANTAVPEPTSGLLLLVGAGMLALRRKRK